MLSLVNGTIETIASHNIVTHRHMYNMNIAWFLNFALVDRNVALEANEL
jgi:hypothetical protein